MKTPFYKHFAGSGFALRELLPLSLSISVILLLQFALLARQSDSTKAGQCQNNLRQLIQAWQMYSDDYQSHLVPGGMGNPNSGKIPSDPAWVGGWLDFTPNFNNADYRLLVDKVTYPHAAHLGPYVSGNPTYFKCPADYSQAYIFGRLFPRTRSVSMNNWMNGIRWGINPDLYVLFRSQDQIASPAGRWVMSEERHESINNGLLQVDMGSETIVDYPGKYHSSGAFLSFADGHVEYKRWTDPRMIPSVEPGVGMELLIPSPDNADLKWLQERTTDNTF